MNPVPLETYSSIENERQHNCFHCGDECSNSEIAIGDKIFCCKGCKLVYELLETKDLCTYYELEQAPGRKMFNRDFSNRFEYLDDLSVQNSLISFRSGDESRVTFKVPSMHCASCIWLLENLHKLNAAVSDARVNFLRREVTLTFNDQKSNLREIVELLASLGYEPEINLASLQREIRSATDRSLYIKIGVAGFAFANIMLLAFPDYLAGENRIDPMLSSYFAFLSFLLSLPVLFYSSTDYFKSAFAALRQHMVNMDVPIAIGITALYGRSMVELINGTGTGYLDSFAGLVLLLLAGKLFQKKTYDALSFDRDYRSYFPVSVIRRRGDIEENISLAQLQTGDRILVRNSELVPADAVLIKGHGLIDYSFVTGEANPVPVQSGDYVYAGGRQRGAVLELDVVKNVSQSYLTQLWNSDTGIEEKHTRVVEVANRFSKYFTAVVLMVAVSTLIYWWPQDIALAMNAFTAVLIIACPCALALSTPFTLGNTLRIFGKNDFYLRSTQIVEKIAAIDYIVFDKTGTLTLSGSANVQFHAADHTPLSEFEMQVIRSLVRHSSHPLSYQIFRFLEAGELQPVEQFNEEPGKGIEGIVNGMHVFIGSAPEGFELESDARAGTRVYAFVNGNLRGWFVIENHFRRGLENVIKFLKREKQISLLSGDSDHERNILKQWFDDEQMYFRQTPFAKKEYVEQLQQQGHRVLMIGDGLNDAGALRQSDVGISISDDLNTFTPACDGILNGKSFERLKQFFKFSEDSLRIIKISFVISILYNLIGIGFAVQGILSPLVSAILMPISSVTVVAFTIGSTFWRAGKLGLNR